MMQFRKKASNMENFKVVTKSLFLSFRNILMLFKKMNIVSLSRLERK